MSLSLKVYSCIQLNHIILSPPPLKTKTVLWGFLLAWEQEFSWFFSKEIALNVAVDSVCPGDEVSSESYANILDWTPETQRDIFFYQDPDLAVLNHNTVIQNGNTEVSWFHYLLWTQWICSYEESNSLWKKPRN